MATAKTDQFEKELQKRAQLFRVLGHPARLQIVLHLAKTRKCLTGDISGMFPLTRTTVNQHMNELKDAGLIKGHVRDGKIVYCLNPENMKILSSILTSFLSDIQLPQDFCCEYMAEKMGLFEEVNLQPVL